MIFNLFDFSICPLACKFRVEMNLQIPAVILTSNHTIVESEKFVLFTHCLQARYVERGILVPEQFLPLGLTLAFPYLLVDLVEFLRI